MYCENCVHAVLKKGTGKNIGKPCTLYLKKSIENVLGKCCTWSIGKIYVYSYRPLRRIRAIFHMGDERYVQEEYEHGTQH